MNKAYFENYCGYGPYAENYVYHSGIEHCIEIVEQLGVRVESVVVLGTATGEVLRHFHDAWRVLPAGCEISRWAHARIPARFRTRIRCTDMRRYVPQLIRMRQHFDLLFSNSFMYLDAQELPGFIRSLSGLCGHLHYWGSTIEDHEEGDAYRVTLRSRAWWNQVFRANGFARTRSPYLWRSLQLGC